MPAIIADHEVILFEDQRSRLLRIGLGILRSAPDAEDVVQEAWLRWQRSKRCDVDNVEAFPTTRLALDRLRRIKSRREVYYGDWPSEPATTRADHTKLDQQQEVSTALAVLFDTLSPLQRAAFVLRDVLAQPYPETAAALGREEPAVRQLVHRSLRLRDAQASCPAERTAEAVLVHQFHRACLTSDVTPLVNLLTSESSTRRPAPRKRTGQPTDMG